MRKKHQQSAVSNQQKQTPTTETQRHGEEPEEEKNLPLIDADERGLEHRPKPVEWKPTPDMYRMDTPEGREAYEARFRSEDRGIGRSGHRDIKSTGTSGDRNTAEGGGAT